MDSIGNTRYGSIRLIFTATLSREKVRIGPDTIAFITASSRTRNVPRDRKRVIFFPPRSGAAFSSRNDSAKQYFLTRIVDTLANEREANNRFRLDRWSHALFISSTEEEIIIFEL